MTNICLFIYVEVNKRHLETAVFHPPTPPPFLLYVLLLYTADIYCNFGNNAERYTDDSCDEHNCPTLV